MAAKPLSRLCIPLLLFIKNFTSLGGFGGFFVGFVVDVRVWFFFFYFMQCFSFPLEYFVFIPCFIHQPLNFLFPLRIICIKKAFIHLTERVQMSSAKLMLYFAQTYKNRAFKDFNPVYTSYYKREK